MEVNGRTVYIPQVPLKVIVDHLMPTVNITEGGAYALKQPNRYGPVSYLWLVGVCAHHGLEIPDDKEEAKRLIIDELRHLRLGVPKELKALEAKLRKQPLRSLVSVVILSKNTTKEELADHLYTVCSRSQCCHVRLCASRNTCPSTKSTKQYSSQPTLAFDRGCTSYERYCCVSGCYSRSSKWRNGSTTSAD